MKNSGFNSLIAFIFIFVIVLSHRTYAQKLPIVAYNVESGLAQSQVKTIVQDSAGFLWFGTADGLSRFDGLQFRTFSHWDGLAFNDLNCSFQDSDGTIFFGHTDGNLTKYNFKTRTFTPILLDSLSRHHPVTGIAKDRNGHIWIGLGQGGVLCYKKGDAYLINETNGLPSNVVRDVICVDQYVYLATDKGLVRIDTGHFKEPASLRILTRRQGLPSDNLSALLKDNRQRVWVGTRDSGLFLLPEEEFASVRFQYSPRNGLAGKWVWDIYQDRKGNLWIGTFSGVSMIEHAADGTIPAVISNITEKNGLSYNGVSAIYQDREGNMYFGTWGGGVNKYRPGNFELFTTAEGLLNNTVWRTVEDLKGRLWVATEGGITIYRMEKQGRYLQKIHTISKKNGLKTAFVTSLMLARNGDIWAGLYGGGLLVFNQWFGIKKYFSTQNGLASDYIVDIKQDRNKNIWVATLERGVSRIQPWNYKIRNYLAPQGLPSNKINSIYISRNGDIVLSTKEAGLLKYDGNTFIPFHKSTNESIIPTMLTEDGQGHYWIATSGSGVYECADSVIRHFSLKNGLSGENVFTIGMDKHHNIWFGTSRGLDRFSGKDSSLQHFGLNEGFLGQEVNQNAFYEDRFGNLWIGTIAGLVCYHEEREVPAAVPPKIVLENVLLGTKNKYIKEGSLLPYNQNYLTFNFIGPYFSNAQSIRYRYRVDGLDEDWSLPTDQHYATYVGIPPGKYIFKVQALNARGQSSLKTAQFSFEILAPFWQKWWFYLLIAAFIALLAFAFHLFHIRRIRRENKLLEIKISQRTKQLEAEKDRVQIAYQVLKENESLFRALTESTSSSIFIYQGTKFVYVNPTTSELTGYSEEELLTMNFWEVVHPDYRELVKKRGRDRQAGQQVPERYEMMLLKPDGAIRWIDFSARPIIYKGQPAALGTAFDITNRKNAEEALIENETRLRTFIDSMPDIVCFKDGRGRWLMANSFTIRLFQLDGKPYSGKTDSELAELSPFYKKIFSQSAASDELTWQKGSLFRNEEIIPLAGSQQKVFDVIKVPLFNEDGSRKALLIIGRDVTEQNIAQKQLIEEKERLQATLSSLAEGVIATDMEGKIVLVNRSAEMILGQLEIDLFGQPVNKVGTLFTEQGKRFKDEPVQRVIESGELYQTEKPVIFRTLKGEEYLVSFTCAPVRTLGKRIRGTVIAFEDVSEKKELEDELLKIRKLESLGVLAGGLAHDFNNILTAIIGNISLANITLQSGDQLKAHSLLKKAEEASLRAQGLTQQLLTFSKGGTPIKKASSVQELIVSSVDFALRGSNVRAHIDIEQNLWSVEIDEGQINQVLNNLSINAMQAMPEGGDIFIKAENIIIHRNRSLPLHEGRYVKIVFRDTGIGIKKENFERIFDPYFSTKQKGSGLGLASTYSIIKKHDGHITVESELGKGAQFIFYLPAAEHQIDHSNEPTIERFEQQSGHILVLDDEVSVRELIKEILESHGYTVTLCQDGQEVLRVYQEFMNNHHPIDLFIMDLTIPGGMGGKRTIKELLKFDPTIKAIVSSGYSNDTIMAEYEQYGFKGVVAKPYNVKQLLRTVQRVMTRDIKLSN